MKTKYNVASITNNYISQLHYLISCVLQLNNESQLNKNIDTILKLTKQFEKKIASEQEKSK